MCRYILSDIYTRVGVLLGVADLLGLRVAVLLAAGVFDTDGVAIVLFVIVRVAVLLGVSVLETDGLGVPVRVIVLEIDGDFVIVFETDGLGVSERVTVRVTEGDFETDLVPVGVADVDRVIVAVFVGERLLENDGSFVGRRGIVGKAVVGNSVGRGGRVGNSVAGSSVIARIPEGSSVKILGNGRMLGYSVTGRIVRSVGSAVFRISGTDGYSGTDGISVRRLGIVSGIDPRIKLDGRSEGISGSDGRTVVGISRGGSVGNAVDGIAGRESVGSIDGRTLINVAITPGMEGRAVYVRVGNGLGLIAPEAFADCDGRIGGIKDGIVKPNCRLRSSVAPVPAPTLASKVINLLSISLESI